MDYERVLEELDTIARAVQRLRREVAAHRPPTPRDHRFPRARPKGHAVVDRDCEACTKKFWTGGSDLTECPGCGIHHERGTSKECAHCECGETTEEDAQQ